MRRKIYSDKKEKILIEAIKVFIDKGKYGARMQKIADKAKINKAMLHYYFTDKDTLYEKSLEYIFTNLFLRVKDFIDEEETALGKINKFVDIYIDFISENIGIARFIAREMADGGQVVKKVMRNLTRQENIFIPLRFIDIIDRAKKDGEIRNVDTVHTLISIIGMSVFYFIGKPVMDAIWKIKPEEQESFIRARKECIIDFINHGLRMQARGNN